MNLFVFVVFILSLNVSLSSHLRINWLNRKLFSKIALKLKEKEKECSSSRNLYSLNNYGMGSSLISVSKAACNSLEEGLTLSLINASNGWIWNSEEFCSKYQIDHQNPLNCYFRNTFSYCKGKEIKTSKHVHWVQYRCPHILSDEYNFTAQFQFQGEFFEYLFSDIHPEVIKRAEIEAEKIFGSNGSPDNMITVHIR